jgi:hypothetical protein
VNLSKTLVRFPRIIHGGECFLQRASSLELKARSGNLPRYQQLLEAEVELEEAYPPQRGNIRI